MITSTRVPASGNSALGHRPQHDGNGKVHAEVPSYFLRKAIWMRILAGLLLLACAPVMMLAILLVCLTSPGPALFRQIRVGKDGKLFDVLKIRTMYRDAEKLSGPVLCQPGDSRITPMGKLLRFLHLDELPQLINVIRGEMCLVGPRPERPEIIARHGLNEIVPDFVDRTQVLPGVTGLAQINLPADLSAECVIPKVQLDLEYIRSANVGLDLRILLCTAMRMIGIRHGRAVRLFGLNRALATGQVQLEQRIDNRPQRVFKWRQKRPVKTPEALAYASSSSVYEASTVLLESTALDSAHGEP